MEGVKKGEERDWHYHGRRILVDSQSSSEAIKALYEAKKLRLKTFSFGLIHKKTGASKGYISDILAGRRHLNQRYWQGFADLFSLEGNARQLFLLFLHRDALGKEEERVPVDHEIRAFKKSLALSLETIPKVQGLFFALEVFCTFGLFGNKPTRDQLKQHFGISRAVELDYALNHLLKMGLIQHVGSLYSVQREHVNFLGSEDGLSFKDYLKESLANASKRMDAWYDKPDQALIESTLISVKAAVLKEKILEIRDTIHKMQSDLESDEGDTLIHFNIQLFPNT